MESCPKCGYPDTYDGNHYKGIYVTGRPCDHCGYTYTGGQGFSMTWISDNDDRENFPVTKALFDALRESSRVVRGLPDWMLYLNPLDLADIRRESPGALREEPWVGVSMLWEFDFKEVEDIEPGFLRLSRLPGDKRELRIETQFLLRCAGCGVVVKDDEEWGGFVFRVRCARCVNRDDRLQPQSEDQDTPSSESQ